MVDLDTIEPIDKPTDWVNGLVIVEKLNRKLRFFFVLTLDVLIKQSSENISIPYRGTTLFSKEFKLVNFWHTTIGRFRCKRLPYGIHSASEVFEKTISLIISDIQGSSLLVREKKKKKKKCIKSLKTLYFLMVIYFFMMQILILSHFIPMI